MIEFVFSRALFLFAFVVVTVTGWVSLSRKRRRLVDRASFANEFLERLHRYVSSRGQDTEAYGLMTYHSVKMQRELGSLGSMTKYKPPFANYFINDYAVILNMLPDLHKTIGDGLMSQISTSYAQTLHEVLLRHLGILNDQRETLSAQLRNPIASFREGVQLFLMLPLYVLQWLGIIATSTLLFWSSSLIVKGFTGVASLVGFVSAIVGLIVGWSEFVDIIRRLFNF